MKEIEYLIHAWDDYLFSMGEKVPADKQDIELSFNGETVTLDLTAGSIAAIREKLAPLFAIGAKAKANKPGKHKAPIQMGGNQSSRVKRAAQRKFAAERGIPVPKHGSTYDYSQVEGPWEEYVAAELAAHQRRPALPQSNDSASESA